MRKLLLTLACVLMLHVPTVWAEESTNLALTQEEAIRLAQINSIELKRLSLDEKSNTEQEEKIRKAFFNNPTDAASIDFDINQMQIALTQRLTRQSITKQKEVIAFSVSQAFISIIREEQAYEQFLQSLAMAERDLSITKLKRDLGLVSEVDYENQKVSYEKSAASTVTHKESLAKAYRTLNQLIGEKDLDKRHDIVYEVEYEELGEFNLTSHIQRVQQIDRTLQTLATNLEKTRYARDWYYISNRNPQTGELMEGNKSLDALELELSGYALDQTERRKAVEDHVRGKHDAILAKERQYQDKLKELEQARTQLHIKEVRLSLGRATPLEVENDQFSVLRLENELQALIYDHYLSMMEFRSIHLI